MKVIWLLGVAVTLLHAKAITFESADDELANELCKDYYREFHSVDDVDTITNEVINNGHEGSVYRCACVDPKVTPQVVAQKLFFDRKLEQQWTNMTQMKLVREEVSAAGLGAELFWYHDRGYFEEFLGHKKDLKDHPTGLTLADKNLWAEHAAQIGKLHTVNVDNIDKAGYTTKFFAEDRGPGGTNTREIIHHFQVIETSTRDCGGDQMISFLNAMGWTYSEYNENISWLENLIRGHFNDQEIPVLSHNDATTGNVMMDKNDTSGESLLLIDFDLATYGYRAFDSAFVMQQISNQMVSDGVSDSFMSDGDINEWLSIYKDNVGDHDLTTEELLVEFNLFMPYVALEKIMKQVCRDGSNANVKFLVCKYEELQRLHNFPKPVNCENFPNTKPNQCDECEAILIDCIRNCEVDNVQCSSTCNREFVDCENNCE